MPQKPSLATYGKRLQIVWLAFAFIGSFLSRVLAHTAFTEVAQARLYALFCLCMAAFAMLAYRHDIRDDMPRIVQSPDWNPFRRNAGFSSMILMFFLAFGLADGIWEIRRESLLLILVFPLNAMFFFLCYVQAVRAKAAKAATGKQPSELQ